MSCCQSNATSGILRFEGALSVRVEGSAPDRMFGGVRNQYSTRCRDRPRLFVVG